MLELLKKRRSIRKYQDMPVDKEQINEILKCALLSPSSKNTKPLEFIVVDDVEIISKLINCKKFGTSPLKSAHCCIVVLGDSKLTDVWVEDASVASTIISLQAESLGLGSCWIQIRNRQSDNESSEDYIRILLNIPSNFGVLSLITLGYKNEDKKSYDDSDINFNKVHYNKF